MCENNGRNSITICIGYISMKASELAKILLELPNNPELYVNSNYHNSSFRIQNSIVLVEKFIPVDDSFSKLGSNVDSRIRQNYDDVKVICICPR
jgi:hypothetical protein